MIPINYALSIISSTQKNFKTAADWHASPASSMTQKYGRMDKTQPTIAANRALCVPGTPSAMGSTHPCTKCSISSPQAFLSVKWFAVTLGEWGDQPLLLAKITCLTFDQKSLECVLCYLCSFGVLKQRPRVPGVITASICKVILLARLLPLHHPWRSIIDLGACTNALTPHLTPTNFPRSICAPWGSHNPHSVCAKNYVRNYLVPPLDVAI